MIVTVIYGGASLFLRAFMDRRGIPKLKLKKVNSENHDIKKSYSGKFEQGSKWFLSQNPERLEMISYDGLKLVGWYLPCENPVRTIMCVHGYRGNGIKDFGYVSQFYHAQNCNVFLIDHRAHGESEGQYICYGNKERRDCVDWLHLLNEKYGNHLPMYVDGVSMGGATVLMTSNMELPSNMAGIISDCGFTSHWNIAAYVMKKEYKVPKYPILPITSLWCRVKAGYWPHKLTTIDCVKEAKVPILFIHGKKDDFVPFSMGMENYEACTSYKVMHAVEDAGHAISYMVDEENCQVILKDFFEYCETNMTV